MDREFSEDAIGAIVGIGLEASKDTLEPLPLLASLVAIVALYSAIGKMPFLAVIP